MSKTFHGWMACLGWLGMGIGYLPAADVSYYGLIKLQQFEQTNAATPVPLPTHGFAFNAFVVPDTNRPFAATNATVKPPGSTPLRNLALNPDGKSLRYEQRFDTQGALDSAYPAGGLFSYYSFTMYTTNDGVRSSSLNFFGIGTPSLPQIENVAAAQAIDTTRDFTVRWRPFTNGSAVDVVQVLVLDLSSNEVYASAAPLQTGALTSTDTSFVIPANTLPPDTALNGGLIFAKPGLPNVISYPDASGYAAIARVTQFPMRTRPQPVPPRLEILEQGPAACRGRFYGEPDRRYHLQTSPDLAQWQDLLVTNSPTGDGPWEDPTTSGTPIRFYRIQVGP